MNESKRRAHCGNLATLVALSLLLSWQSCHPVPASARGRWGAAPDRAELAAVFQRLAEGYLERSDVSEAKRAELRAAYYTDAEADLYASAVLHGLEHRGVTRERWAPYVALVTATVFQQSSGKRPALSYNGADGEPLGEDVGWYQIRRRWVFGPGGVWHEVYPDRPVPETREAETAALLDPMTAAPLWVAHLLRQERTCGAYLRTIRTRDEARRKLAGPDGDDPLRYCRAVFRRDGVRYECSRTRRCYVVRAGFGVPTYNMGASHVVEWGRRYRQALRSVRAGEGES